MATISLRRQRKRKALEASIEQPNSALGTAVVPPRETACFSTQAKVPTSVTPSSGSTPPIVFELMEVDPFSKVYSGASKPFKATFYGTDNAQIMEMDSGICRLSITKGMFVNVQLNVDIVIAREQYFSTARDYINTLMYMVISSCNTSFICHYFCSSCFVFDVAQRQNQGYYREHVR